MNNPLAFALWYVFIFFMLIVALKTGFTAAFDPIELPTTTPSN